MKSYVARQPIFNAQLEVEAYELLFRSGLEEAFRSDDAEQATMRVMVDNFLSAGMPTLTDGKLGFINFTRDLLVNEYAFLFPKDSIVVEVLETVKPEPAVIDACSRLHQAGYTIALDDFEYSPAWEPLIDLCSIIKVDFMACEKSVRAEYARQFLPRGIKLLAEKVETHEEHMEAAATGYTYFQGYFFSKPVILTREHLPESKASALRLMQEANKPDLSFNRLETVVKSDVSLSYKLLKYINSSFFGLRQDVHSIKQALVLLGQTNVRKWSSLVALSALSDDQPEEQLMTSLVRARMNELLAPHVGMRTRDQDLFLLGMFSLIDALTGKPMDMILEDIQLAGDIKEALLNRAGPLQNVFEIVLAYERGDWGLVDGHRSSFGLPDNHIGDVYYDSVLWTQDLLQHNTPPESSPSP